MKKPKLPGNCKGVSMVIISVAVSVILSCSALVIDIGRVVIERQKMQNAVDASAIAAAYELPDTEKARETARRYAELNGIDPDNIEVIFSDGNRTVDVKARKTVEFTLARVVGIDSADTSTLAVASLDTLGDAFNYTLFSGSETSTLTMNGSGMYVEGSSHSNKSFIANGSNLTITGTCEACTTVTTNGSNIAIGTRSPNSPLVEMPDFSEILKLQAEAAGQLYTGNKTFNGSSVNVDAPIYVDGNVTVNGSKFTGKGCILATGSITFNGSNLNNSADDAVCFYSKNGSITVNGSNALLDGMLYAPNGNITMNGSYQTVHGRVIGKTLTFNGSGLNIIGGSSDLTSLPSYGVKLVR